MALSEGVFAVVMTLMLLSVIDAVDSDSFQVDRLGATLLALWPKFTAFFISFIIVGASWVSDNVVLEQVRAVDVRYLWWKLLYLFMVTFLGFSTTLIGEHPDHWLVEMIYGVNMLGLYLTGWLSWRYALNADLLDRDAVDESLLKTVWSRLRIGIVAYAIGPLLSIWDPMASFAYFMILGLTLIILQVYSTFEWAPLLHDGSCQELAEAPVQPPEKAG